MEYRPAYLLIQEYSPPDTNAPAKLMGYGANVYHHTKFRRNRSNRCWHQLFSCFQNGGRMPLCIFF